MADIGRRDIAALHHELPATPYQANHTVQVLSHIFTLAEVWGLLADGTNPYRPVSRFREEKRERFFRTRSIRASPVRSRRARRQGWSRRWSWPRPGS